MVREVRRSECSAESFVDPRPKALWIGHFPEGVRDCSDELGAKAGASELVLERFSAFRVTDVVVLEGAPRLGATGERLEDIGSKHNIVFAEDQFAARVPFVRQCLEVGKIRRGNINPKRLWR